MEGLNDDPIALVNASRAKAGLAPLRVHPALVKAAQGHSDDMAKAGRMFHNGPGRSNPSSRMKAAGYSFKYNGECVAWGQQTAAEVVAAWLADRPHRAILQGPQYTHIGVASNGTFWTADLASGMPDPPPDRADFDLW